MSRRSGEVPGLTGSGCLVAAVAGSSLGAGGALLLGRAWADCEVGLNTAANSFALLFVLGAVAVAGAVWWAVLWWLGSATRRWLTFALGVLGSLALLWGVTALWHAPGGYPAATCGPGGRPTWWPGWLPL